MNGMQTSSWCPWTKSPFINNYIIPGLIGTASFTDATMNIFNCYEKFKLYDITLNNTCPDRLKLCNKEFDFVVYCEITISLFSLFYMCACCCKCSWDCCSQENL